MFGRSKPNPIDAVFRKEAMVHAPALFGAAVRFTRSSADAEKMRADILAKRAKGVPATKLADKYGVTTAYIYMIK